MSFSKILIGVAAGAAVATTAALAYTYYFKGDGPNRDQIPFNDQQDKGYAAPAEFISSEEAITTFAQAEHPVGDVQSPDDSIDDSKEIQKSSATNRTVRTSAVSAAVNEPSATTAEAEPVEFIRPVLEYEKFGATTIKNYPTVVETFTGMAAKPADHSHGHLTNSVLRRFKRSRRVNQLGQLVISKKIIDGR